MAPIHIFNIERRRSEAFRDGFNLGGRYKHEYGGRIDKAANQPRTCNAVDLGARTRDPDRAVASVALWNLVGRNGGQFGGCPAEMSTFEDFGLDIATAQQGSGTLAELLAFLADDDDGLAGHAGGPVLGVEMRSADGARYQSRIRREILIDSNIDETRRVGRADESRQFVG